MSVGNRGGGRPRKPLKLHILHGTLRKDREHQLEPQPEAAIPTPPKQVKDNPEALKEWNRIAPQLLELGILSELDEATLAVYCIEYRRYLKAVTELAKGEVFKSPKSQYPLLSPWLSVANQAWSRCEGAIRELGLSAQARTKIKGDGAGLKKPDLKKGVHRFLA